MSVFVDANVFIRFFAWDDDAQAEAAERLFTAAREGKARLVTGPPVFFELAWTLGYRYKVARGEILDIIEAVLAFPNMTVTDGQLVLAAVALARETNSDFADSYIAASAAAHGAESIATFNKKALRKARLQDIRRALAAYKKPPPASRHAGGGFALREIPPLYPSFLF